MILRKEKIDEVFEKNTDPGKCLLGVYSLVAEEAAFLTVSGSKLADYPRVGKALHRYLLDQFGRFGDEERNFWRKHGFTLDDKLEPWEMRVDHRPIPPVLVQTVHDMTVELEPEPLTCMYCHEPGDDGEMTRVGDLEDEVAHNRCEEDRHDPRTTYRPEL